MAEAEETDSSEFKTILIVDGDEVSSRAEARVLEDAGFRVLAASSLDEAQAVLGGHRVDLVIVDARLDAERIIGARELPFLTLYSRTDSAVVERSSSIPCYGFVARGEDAVVLSASVASALALFASRRRQADGAGELMKELQHRVKNGLNIASSLLRLQMDELEDEGARKAIHDAVLRLRAMSAIYEKLYSSNDIRNVDLGAYLRELAESVFMAFAPEGSGLSLALDIAELRLDSNRGVYLGLILTELMTNAVKYAYPGGAGEIRVSLETADGEARLRVSDTGVGLPPGLDPERATSLGLTLVNMLASQIGADLRIESAGGTSVTLGFSA